MHTGTCVKYINNPNIQSLTISIPDIGNVQNSVADAITNLKFLLILLLNFILCFKYSPTNNKYY